MLTENQSNMADVGTTTLEGKFKLFQQIYYVIFKHIYVLNIYNIEYIKRVQSLNTLLSLYATLAESGKLQKVLKFPG